MSLCYWKTSRTLSLLFPHRHPINMQLAGFVSIGSNKCTVVESVEKRTLVKKERLQFVRNWWLGRIHHHGAPPLGNGLLGKNECIKVRRSSGSGGEGENSPW